MVQVIVERSFADPAELEALEALEHHGMRCLEEHRVRFLRTLVSKDRCRMICLYEAPDAESVRLAQRKAGMPLDCAWTGLPTAPAAGSPVAPPAAREQVVVERTFAEPMTPAAIATVLEKGLECGPRHQVAYLGGHLSADGRRMICVFQAPDAESVRIANRHAGAPFDRVWTAEIHMSSG